MVNARLSLSKETRAHAARHLLHTGPGLTARKRSLSAASGGVRDEFTQGRFLYWNKENGSSGAEVA